MTISSMSYWSKTMNCAHLFADSSIGNGKYVLIFISSRIWLWISPTLSHILPYVVWYSFQLVSFFFSHEREFDNLLAMLHTCRWWLQLGNSPFNGFPANTNRILLLTAAIFFFVKGSVDILIQNRITAPKSLGITDLNIKW